jgi:predicted DNA-binding transcriptional regulator YafY
MSRAQRLLDLLQILRRHRQPVAGDTLAREVGVSLRTLYRDIATLQSQGAEIDGEPGVGYRLKPGFLLPPLMFTAEETEALVLGSRWVADRADPKLGDAARNALAKIAAVLPAALRDEIDNSALLIGPAAANANAGVDLGLVRDAIRRESVVTIDYRDKDGTATTRDIWPFALGFFDEVRVVVAWCALRAGFRHFRADRIATARLANARYPRRRAALLKEWRQTQGIAVSRTL